MSPRLYGPLPLTPDRIQKNVQSGSAGIFALGLTVDGTFLTKQIGRSDEDLRLALLPHVGGPYPHFKFAYAISARDAFEKECELFHSLVTLDVPIHPAPPEGTDLSCRGCRAASHAGHD